MTTRKSTVSDERREAEENKSQTEPTEAQSKAVEASPDKEAVHSAKAQERGPVKDDVQAVFRNAAVMNDPKVNSVLEQLAQALGFEGKYSTVYGRTVWDFEGEVAD